MRIDHRSSPHRVAGRAGRVPSWIVLHTTVGSFDSAALWFEDPASQVSAHYLVGLDGRVATFVPEEDAARHAGRVLRPSAARALASERAGVNINLTTFGIELVDDGDPHGIERTDAQYAAAARLVALASQRWGIAIDPGSVVGHREITADKTCPGNLDLERVRTEARAWLEGGPADRPMIVGLLPARNAEAFLPGWLESAPAWCDAVIALDDGSTDATRVVLESAPIVRTLLSEPPRPTATGWHDGRNRQRLLDAAGTLVPDWIVQIDADEALDPDDARALRRFLSTDAVPGLVYGLRHYRTWGEAVDPTPRWVYRVFAWEPGQAMPDEPLHFPPVPLDMPRAAWLRTSIRLRHLSAADEEQIRARLHKYGEADPGGVYPVDFGGLDAAPTRLAAWTPRAPAMPVLISPNDDLEDEIDGELRPLLAVLLPVRNGEQDLPGWLDAIRGLADVVIALDDGSVDGTLALLEAEPLARSIRTHAPRPSAAGWDDAANRQELLEAADAIRPRWILFLDADERIDAADAAALREFLGSDAADRRAAYAFLVHRMIGPEAFDRADLWVHRLFAWRPGLLLPDRRLHLVPVPVSVPPSRWRQTSVRIRHLASLTQERRAARYQKYRDADPGRDYQADYEELLEPPGPRRPWLPRPTGLPVPLETSAGTEDLGFDPDAPVLSAIVIARDDADRIEHVVRSVVLQECPEPFEVIVVVSGSPETAAVVKEAFPDLTLVSLERPALPGAARNAGLAVARGDYVSFPGSHIELPQGSLAARIRAHERGYPMVTGTMLNGTRTPAGWASYFLDHSGSLPGRPSEELRGPPAHCSYDRGILQQVGGFPEDLRAGEDTVVNVALTRLGFRTLRAADVVLTHSSPCRNVPTLVCHHFMRGRGFGRILLEQTPQGAHVLRREVLSLHLIRFLPRRIGGTKANVQAWGGAGLQGAYARVAPLVWLGAASSWAGTWFEILRTL